MKYRNFWGKLTIPSLILRIAVPPLVFISPFYVSIACFWLDAFDSFFYRNAGFTEKRYQPYDKFLDLYWSTFSIIYAYNNLPYFNLLAILYAFRLMGQLTFFAKYNHKILVYFPNFFEFFFLLLIFIQQYPFYSYLISEAYFAKTMIYLAIAKLLQEIYLHTRVDEWSYKFQPPICQWPKK